VNARERLVDAIGEGHSSAVLAADNVLALLPELFSDPDIEAAAARAITANWERVKGTPLEQATVALTAAVQALTKAAES
jgi:hypothetical protein